MQKDFDQWNEIKKRVDGNKAILDRFPKPGEVWMCVVGKNIGYEQNGGGDNFSRPVLIITKFNNHILWTVPLSTKQKRLDFYFNFTDPKNQQVSAILAQMRLMSIKRFRRKLYDFSDKDFNQVKTLLKNFII